MARQFHPLKIEMLLHYGMKNYKFESIEQAAAVRANHELFVEHGFLRMLPAPPYYAITIKGVEYIDRLCGAAFQIAKRLNNGNDVVKPALSDEARKLMGDFEAYNMFDVEPYTTRYGAPNWGRSHVSFKVPLRMGPNKPRGKYSAEFVIPREQGEKLKDFIAAATLGEAWRPELRPGEWIDPTVTGGKIAVKPAWMTPEWEALYDRWSRWFDRRGQVGAMKRRLFDMVFAKTDKLRDAVMRDVVSKSLRGLGPRPSYSAIRRAILDAERPK